MEVAQRLVFFRQETRLISVFRRNLSISVPTKDIDKIYIHLEGRGKLSLKAVEAEKHEEGCVACTL